jgi:hypothetical protein
MAPPGHEFGRTFADALGAFTSREGAVIQEEAKQVQIPLPQVPPEKEIAPQATIEVLGQGTAAGCLVHSRDDGLQHRVEFPPELSIQVVAALPVGTIGAKLS